MIKSRSMVELTSELEAEIRARTKIRPDEPNTKPGDPGNGHVLVVDERTQKFNGFTYRLYAKAYYFVRFVGKKQFFLHKEVWAFHNDVLPSRNELCIHHERKDANGNWDTSCNDIEWLLLMTPAEHKAWHAKYHPPIEIECAVCHKIFIAKSKTAKYCPVCTKQVSLANNRINRSKNRKPFQTFEESTKNLPAVADESENIPRVLDDPTQVVRYCFFCHRPFVTKRNKDTVSCARPDCAGRSVANAYEQAKLFVMKQRIDHCGGVFKFVSRKIQKDIRCLFIDGKIWFVAKDVAAALGYKDTKKAIHTHVKPPHKKTINRTEFDLNRGAGLPRGNGAVSGINPEIVIIDEAGLYRLSFSSKLPEAEAFTEWVTSVVLPTLRKYGQFIITDESAPPMLLPEDTVLVRADVSQI